SAMESPGKFIEDDELRETIKETNKAREHITSGKGTHLLQRNVPNLGMSPVTGSLGTPATRAEIIEKLLYTNYIERNGKELLPTSKGFQLVNLVAPELRSPELTARWEQRLTEIARGRESKTKFIKGIRENAAQLVRSVETNTAAYKADNISRTKCPACGKYMLLVNGKRGKMLVCQDRECGHRQPEKESNLGFTSSRHASRTNQKLISRFSDQESIGSSLGDLLKKALAQEERDK
ncbi:MAG: DNA topoisomerase, partial [Desulfotomaculaceae bacterium]